MTESRQLKLVVEDALVDSEKLAYVAGAIDSDGCIGIQKRKENGGFCYIESVGLGQVTPVVPIFLRETFGGYIHIRNVRQMESWASHIPHRRALYKWSVGSKSAANAVAQFFPFLKIKRLQAGLLLELRLSRQPKYQKEAYWYANEFPDWQQDELITYTKAQELLSWSQRCVVAAAVSDHRLLALPFIAADSSRERPRIPLGLIERLLRNASSNGRCRNSPPELVEWRERLYQESRSLNTFGYQRPSKDGV